MSNRKPVVTVRSHVTPEDSLQSQRVEWNAWAHLYDDIEDNEQLLIDPFVNTFREGMLTAFVDGVGAGNFALNRLNYDMDHPLARIEDVADSFTMSNYVEDGDTIYGCSLGVDPAYRGHGIGQMLVHAAQALVVKLNCKRLVLGCRIPDYHLHADIPVEEYITLRREDGQFLDKELRFYGRAGMTFIKPLPEYMSGDNADPESLNYGVLSVWENPNFHEA